MPEKKSLPLEILIKLILKFYLYIPQYIVEHSLYLIVNTVHFIVILTKNFGVVKCRLNFKN